MEKKKSYLVTEEQVRRCFQLVSSKSVGLRVHRLLLNGLQNVTRKISLLSVGFNLTIQGAEALLEKMWMSANEKD